MVKNLSVIRKQNKNYLVKTQKLLMRFWYGKEKQEAGWGVEIFEKEGN